MIDKCSLFLSMSMLVMINFLAKGLLVAKLLRKISHATNVLISKSVRYIAPADAMPDSLACRMGTQMDENIQVENQSNGSFCKD